MLPAKEIEGGISNLVVVVWYRLDKLRLGLLSFANCSKPFRVYRPLGIRSTCAERTSACVRLDKLQIATNYLGVDASAAWGLRMLCCQAQVSGIDDL